MHLDLVVFGLIGTTVPDDGIVARPMRAALACADASVESAQIDAVRGLATPYAVRLLLQSQRTERVCWSTAEVERVHDVLVKQSLARCASDSPIREMLGASQAFWRLRQRGTKIAIVTGLVRSIADVIVDRLGWRARGLVDAVIASDDTGRGAPFPDMIDEAMRQTRVSSKPRVMCVASSPAELQQGSAAGCSLVVAVAHDAKQAAELKRYPHTVQIPTCALVPELLQRIDARSATPMTWSP